MRHEVSSRMPREPRSAVSWKSLLAVWLLIVLAIVFGHGCPAGAAEPRQLGDLATGGVAPGATTARGPDGYVATAQGAVFVVHDVDPPTHTLWGTDGTETGTHPLVTFATAPSPTIATHGRVVFVAAEPGADHRLWSTDGTAAGTFAISGGFADGGSAASLHGAALLSLCDAEPNGGCGLWRSDGTASGTRRIAAVTAALDLSATLDDALLFIAVEKRRLALWRSDGTAHGTFRLRWLGHDVAYSLTVAGGRLWFMAGEGGDELWISDGTGKGTRRIARHGSCGERFGCTPRLYGAQGDALLLSDSQFLWRIAPAPGGSAQVGSAPYGNFFSDGLAQLVGSRLLLGIPNDGLPILAALGPSDERPVPLAGCPDGCPSAQTSTMVGAADGRALVVARSRDGGADLWVSDATGAGTSHLARLLAPPAENPTAFPASLFASSVALGARTLLAVADPMSMALWSTDGTAAGSERLADLVSDGSASYRPPPIAVADSRAFFSAYDSEAGIQPWVTDGTAAGTHRIAIVQSHAPSSDPRGFVGLPNAIVFRACDGARTVVWGTDGHATPRPLLVERDGCGRLRSDSPLVAVGGRAFWSAPDEAAGPGVRQLWSTDGTPAGTRPLSAFRDRQASAPFAWNGFVGFAAQPLLGGAAALWRSDGTPAGTSEVLELPADLADLQSFAGLGSEVFFAARQADGNLRFFRSDGTASGTRRVTASGPWLEGTDYGDYPFLVPRFTRLGDAVVFQMCDGQGNDPGRCGLWRTEGVADDAALTLQGAAIGDGPPAILDGKLYLFDWDGLVRTDGTASGTELVSTVSPPAWTDPRPTVLGDHVYFFGNDDAHGDELWTTDGTAAGTVRVTDLVPGADGSEPSGLVAWSGRVWWAATRPDVGNELWSLEPGGNPTLAADVAPGPASSSPMELTPLDGWLLWSADDARSGREPWALASAP